MPEEIEVPMTQSKAKRQMRKKYNFKKERTHQLNSKFDKTYKKFFEILSLFDIRIKSQFI